MSCNAWNHSSNCSCGWGGDGHLGPRTLLTDLIRSNITFSTYRDLHKGFTNPNAKCPVCGCAVFFYSSQFGGRVFFDELGPPWTKHPCTDTGRTVTLLPIHVSLSPDKLVKFEKNGWVPFLCLDIRPVRDDPSISELTGLVNDQKQTLFVIKDGLSEASPFLIKLEKNGEVWLSAILHTKSEIKADSFRAFKYESNLRTLIREPSFIKGWKNSQTLRPSQGRKPLDTKQISQLSKLNTGLYQCPQCSVFVRNLTKHKKIAHSTKNLSLCPDCGQQVRKIENHYERMHSPKALDRIQLRKENSIKRRTENKIKKQGKAQISNVAKKGACPFCKFKSTTEIGYIAHIIAAHNKDPRLISRP